MSWIDEGVNLLLDGHTPKAIAAKLKIDEALVLETFEKLGLSDYKAFKVSKPQETIYDVCCKTFGKTRVKQEFYLENNSRADIAVPDLYLVVEYHGVQHFKFIEFFHKTLDSFNLQKQADKKKEAYCKDNGWIYVVFTPEEPLDPVTVKRKIVRALLAHAVEDPRPMNKHKNSYQEHRSKSQRDYRRQQYKTMKEFKNNQKRNKYE
jgi:hypothetical protein